MARTGVWKGSISLGLLNIPVTLQSAQQEKELHFSLLDEEDFAPIHFRRVNAATGREVPYQRIIKGYEYEEGEYIALTAADFKVANPKATETINIEDFVLLNDIDPMLFEKPYYLVPQKGGEKGYFLLRDALRQTARVAVGKIVLRTKQHLAIIMARGDYLVLELLRFAHEVLETDEAKYLEHADMGDSSYSPREMQMARELIDGMTVSWDPDKYSDTYYNDLMKRIKAKIKAGQVHELTPPEEVPPPPPPAENVVDLLPLLRRTLEEHTKPKGRSPNGGHKKVRRHAKHR